MGRELRRVPANWAHPKKENGDYQPMYNRYYGDALDEWLNNNKMWSEGTHPDLLRDPELKDDYPFYSMWDGDSPCVDFYHKKKYDVKELTHIQLYQTTSEGTPISPVFKADELDKLCEYAEKNCTTFASFKASKEEWIKMLSNDMVYHQEGNVMFF